MSLDLKYVGDFFWNKVIFAGNDWLQAEGGEVKGEVCHSWDFYFKNLESAQCILHTIAEMVFTLEYLQVRSAGLKMEDKGSDLQDHKIPKRWHLHKIAASFHWYHDILKYFPIFIYICAFKVSQRGLLTRRLQKLLRWEVIIQMFVIWQKPWK